MFMFTIDHKKEKKMTEASASVCLFTIHVARVALL